jgi:hypothetical protein
MVMIEFHVSQLRPPAASATRVRQTSDPTQRPLGILGHSPLREMDTKKQRPKD